MRLVFAGSPAVAVPSLRALNDSAHDVVAVVSQPARPVGRKKILTATPVAAAAMELGLQLYTPNSSSELLDVLEKTQPDLAITVAYGRLIRPSALAIPASGWWNIHFSLLPRWRGATPVQHSLLHGDTQTGVTLFQLDEGLDTGPILAQRVLSVDPTMTAGDLLDTLGGVGAELLIDTLTLLERGDLSATPQVGEATYAPKLTRDDGLLRWSDTSDSVLNRFRAVTPEPGAHTVIDGTGAGLTILDLTQSAVQQPVTPGELALVDGEVIVGTADWPVVLKRVQPAGKKPMSARDWWNGLSSQVRFVG